MVERRLRSNALAAPLLRIVQQLRPSETAEKSEANGAITVEGA